MTDEQLQATDEQQECEWTAEEHAKRAIVLQVLHHERPERWSRGDDPQEGGEA